MTDQEHTPKVAIIDDVLGTRLVIRDMLLEMGYEDVVEFSNGEEALEACQDSPPHLVICDYSMATMSGVEVLAHLKENPNTKNIPFIMISAHSDLDQIEEAIAQGALTYIFKPIDFRTLQSTILTALKRLK